MSNKESKNKIKQTFSISEIREMFSAGEEIRLSSIDTQMLVKLIIYCLDATLTDADGNPPNFTINNNFVFIELEDLRYTLEIRNNNKYS